MTMNSTINAQEYVLGDAATQITITMIQQIKDSVQYSYQASELISASNMPMLVIAAAPIIQ